VFQNRLCWPRENDQKVADIFSEIKAITRFELPTQKVLILLGFSNGGFFVNRVAKITQQNPFTYFVVVGAGGEDNNQETFRAGPTLIVIGKKDEFHFKLATELASSLTRASLPVVLTTHEGGHMIPFAPLLNGLQELLNKYPRKEN
jgi:predicted esterase